MSTSRKRPRPAVIICLFCIAVVIGFCVVVAAMGDHTTAIRVFQWAYVGAYIGYATIVWLLIRRRGRLPGRWRWWFGLFVLVRLIPILSAPSDDLYRYVWEGRVQSAGLNPYSIPPDDSRLQELRTSDWNRINHPSYTAIYPPLAQYLFRLAAWIHPSVLAVKAISVAFDILTVFLLGLWLRRIEKNPHWAVLYALNPLVLTAFAIEGHVDSVMLACLAAFGWACAGSRWWWSAVFLAGAISAKTVAVVLLGWLVLTRWWTGVVVLVLVGLSYWPFADAGPGLLDSLMRFSTERDFFTLFYPWLTVLTAGDVARWISAGLLMLILAWWMRRGLPVAEYAGRALGALVLLMPVVHIWYVTWPLLLQPFRARWSWLVLGGTMVFYFEAEQMEATTGAWDLPTWTVWATYGPFLLVWLMERGGLLERDGYVREDEEGE